ncbi:MAG: glutaredoxin family protein [Chloroflexi bacterium]|nr:glutaredoxin family protein [Chloroflexota bacterium]
MTTPREVILYTRQNCGLCDEAAEELRALAQEMEFALDEVDIDENPMLHERYDAVVPVIAIGDRTIAEAPVDRASLRDLVREALG